jgi:hypothetical protein
VSSECWSLASPRAQPIGIPVCRGFPIVQIISGFQRSSRPKSHDYTTQSVFVALATKNTPSGVTCTQSTALLPHQERNYLDLPAVRRRFFWARQPANSSVIPSFHDLPTTTTRCKSSLSLQRQSTLYLGPSHWAQAQSRPAARRGPRAPLVAPNGDSEVEVCGWGVPQPQAPLVTTTFLWRRQSPTTSPVPPSASEGARELARFEELFGEIIPRKRLPKERRADALGTRV